MSSNMTALFIEQVMDSMTLMADASGQLLRAAVMHPSRAHIKDDGSPVTSIDVAVEDMIRSIISQRHPDHGIIGEERENILPDAEFVWVIDPIDGTLPFLAGLPVFGTLIALLYKNEPIVGVIDMPMTYERWVGVTGAPTTLNGKPICTRPCLDLSSAMMSTSNQDFYNIHTMRALQVMKDATSLAVYGGSCMSYGRLASGYIDVAMDVDFDVFDYLAMVPIIEGAGGVISDWQGRPLNRQSGDKFVAVGDPHLHDQVLSVLSTYS